MPLYQVRAGCNHGAQRQYGPGAVVELPEDAAAGFADKLFRLPDVAQEPGDRSQESGVPEHHRDGIRGQGSEAPAAEAKVDPPAPQVSGESKRKGKRPVQ